MGRGEQGPVSLSPSERLLPPGSQAEQSPLVRTSHRRERPPSRALVAAPAARRRWWGARGPRLPTRRPCARPDPAQRWPMPGIPRPCSRASPTRCPLPRRENPVVRVRLLYGSGRCPHRVVVHRPPAEVRASRDNVCGGFPQGGWGPRGAGPRGAGPRGVGPCGPGDCGVRANEATPTAGVGRVVSWGWRGPPPRGLRVRRPGGPRVPVRAGRSAGGPSGGRPRPPR